MPGNPGVRYCAGARIPVCGRGLAVLRDADFAKIRGLMYKTSWVDLNESKRELVKARLAKRLRALNLESYGDYVKLVSNDTSGVELSAMVDTLTTNLTSFFRESDHFAYLRDTVLKKACEKKQRRLRIWSAGCSTGEEALSIAIIMRESIPRLDSMDASILATDISSKVLDTARMGIYPESRFASVPDNIRDRYFRQIKKGRENAYQASSTLTRLVHYRRHSLAGSWPMKGPFDAIFCRNVMIYFDRDAKESLLRRFTNALDAEGVLFVGHSESLTNISENYRYVAPGIYQKS